MGRNTFEPDPAEELPLFETVQRELADNEVDDVVRSMGPAEIAEAERVQFGAPGGETEERIAKLEQEGLYATARFFRRLQAKQASTRD